MGATVVVVGGGPAGLMAAERLAETGVAVEVMEAMPTVGRKFLLAGRSGLNLTHAEDFTRLLDRYGKARPALEAALKAFSPERLRQWAEALGSETFVGTSGRIFPVHMKASPLLRSWVNRLAATGVTIRTRWRWTGFGPDGALHFSTPDGPAERRPAAVVFALGGASWPRLGSDAAWVAPFEAVGIPVVPLRPANCGFDVAWSDMFRQRFAGAPVKSVTARPGDGDPLQGEFVVTATGVEGSLVYALSAPLRDTLEAAGTATLVLDLLPGRDAARITADLARQPARQSFANRLRKATGLEGVKAALVREVCPDAAGLPPADLAARLKALQLPIESCRPIAEAISTAGGVSLAALGPGFRLAPHHRLAPGTAGPALLPAPPADGHTATMEPDRNPAGTAPGDDPSSPAGPSFVETAVFACGEMLDWEAPTGGYLLTACFATGRAAAEGVLDHLGRRPAGPPIDAT